MEMGWLDPQASPSFTSSFACAAVITAGALGWFVVPRAIFGGAKATKEHPKEATGMRKGLGKVIRGVAEGPWVVLPEGE